MHILRGECEYLVKNYEKADETFDEILRHSSSDIDSSKVDLIRINLYTTKAKYREATDLGIKALCRFGMRLNGNATLLTVMKEVVLLKMLLRKVSPEDLIEMPEIQDPGLIMALKLLEKTAMAAFYINRNLNISIACFGARICLTHGYVGFAPYLFCALGGVLGSGLGDFEMGHRFGQTAMELLRGNRTIAIKEQAVFIYAWLLQHWKKHAKEDIPYFREAYKLSVEAGNLLFACHGINNIGDYTYVLEDNIDDIYADYIKYDNFVRSIKDPFIYASFTDNVRGYYNFKGKTDGVLSFNMGDDYDEKRVGQIVQLKNSLDKFLYYLLKMKIAYINGMYAQAYSFGREIDGLEGELVGTIHVP
ncbi:MAG: hypothetical protein ACRCUT_12805, partial [Spirochaetota bacterium]